MHTLKNWTAKRAGAYMTVIGRNNMTPAGETLKIVGVREIRPNAQGNCHAIGSDGTTHILIMRG